MTLQIVATDEHRLFSRILQVLEGRRIPVHMFTGTIIDGIAHISTRLRCESDQAYRLQALLYRLEDVRSVTVFASSNEESGPRLLP